MDSVEVETIKEEINEEESVDFYFFNSNIDMIMLLVVVKAKNNFSSLDPEKRYFI